MVKDKLQNFSLTKFEKYLHNDTCETEVNVNTSVNNSWKIPLKKLRFPLN
jgi:hypothetical protein